MSELNFFASGHSKSINDANRKDLPDQVKKNDDEYKKNQQKK